MTWSALPTLWRKIEKQIKALNKLDVKEFKILQNSWINTEIESPWISYINSYKTHKIKHNNMYDFNIPILKTIL